jgi:hypothetical protein
MQPQGGGPKRPSVKTRESASLETAAPPENILSNWNQREKTSKPFAERNLQLTPILRIFWRLGLPTKPMKIGNLSPETG